MATHYRPPRKKRKPQGRKRRLWEIAQQTASKFKNEMFREFYLYATEQMLFYDNDVFLKFISQLKQQPVDIETFLDSPDFMGATDLELWPKVRETIVAINKYWWKGKNREKGAKTEALLAGATGTGKSEIIKVTAAYHLHILHCLKNPQKIYGLPSSTTIVFMVQAAKPHVTKKIIYIPLRNYIQTMPWFRRNARFETKVESEMFFSGLNIRVVPGGSDSDSVLGEAIIFAALDEVNFMNVVQKSKKAEAGTGRPGVYDQARNVYDTVSRRREGRFMYPGPQIGGVIASSSTRYVGDFTDKRKVEIDENDEYWCYVYNVAQYEARPADKYSGKKMRIVVENAAAADIRILKPDERAYKTANLIELPEEYEPYFRRDPAGALRDVVGMSVNALHPFIRKRNKVDDAVVRGIEKGLESILVKDNVILGLEGLPRVAKGKYCQNPGKPRYVHIDLAINGDRCGVSMVRFDGFIQVAREDGEIETLPRATVELAVGVQGDHGEEVDIYEIRSWVKSLKVKYGYPIRAVTYDGWNCESDQTLMWTSKGLVKAADLEIGDLVQTRTGPRPIEKVFRYDSAPLFRITTQHGHSIEVTPQHKLEVLQKWDWSGPGNQRSPVWGWARADDIQEGDVVRIWDQDTQVDVNDLYRLRSPQGLPETMDENLARLLGVLFGNGWFVDGEGFGISCQEDVSQDMVAVISDALDIRSSVKWYPLKEANCGRVQVTNRVVSRWLSDNNLDDKNSIPEAVRRSPLRVQAAFLSGLFAADGSIKERDGQVSVEQSKECYIDYIMNMLVMGFGMSVNKTHRPSRIVDLPQQKDYQAEESWILQITGSRKRFYEEIGFACARKQEKLSQYLDIPGRKIFSKVSSVEYAGVHPVVDFQIQEDHSYLAHGFVSHNSLESRQQWKKERMKTGEQSVDRTVVPYAHFRDAIYDDRIDIVDNPELIDEIYGLEFDDTKNKVDHPPNGCFTGDTRVALADGTCPTFKEIAQQYPADQPFYVYTMGPDGVRIGPAYHSRVTKRASTLVEVTLDNFQVIRCTPEHLFMTLQGDWIKARDLTPDVSIMPLYRSREYKGGWSGYERVWCPVRESRFLTHHIAAEEPEEGYVVHHRDGVKHNNDPRNLEVLPERGHARHHGTEQWAQKETAIRDGHRRYREDAQAQKAHSRRMKDLWASGKYGDPRQPCAIEGCDDLSSSRGLCGKHYQQARRAKTLPERTSKKRNHRVLSVIQVTADEDVYDITVPETENFALASGVFVHNSKDIADSACGAYYTLLKRSETWQGADADYDEEEAGSDRQELGPRNDAGRPE